MRRVMASSLLLGIQLALVLSVAGKYLYELKTRPRVWVRTAQYDPETPLRGRYLALQPVVDACALSRDKKYYNRYQLDFRTKEQGAWSWQVELNAEDGHLVPRLQTGVNPEGTSTVRLPSSGNCERARVDEQLLYFVPEHSQPPFPLAPGHELWVEVTVPTTSPPRPVQLAISSPEGFRPLRFE